MLNVKKFLKSVLPERCIKKLSYIKNNYFDGYALKSYSQEGEDIILRRIFENQKTGFYVDIGAHHPKRFSNTYIFYKEGWRGINIDPMPGSMKLFNKLRPNDINLEIGISSNRNKLTYYIFNEPALNTFDEKLAKERDGKNGYYIEKIVEMETYPLEEILDKYLPPNQEIDFLSIDTEGYDLYVLSSNNFSKYKPKVILIEVLGYSLEEIINHEISKFLKSYNYIIFAKTFNTVFYLTKEFFNEVFGKKDYDE